jgi:hypothetical protein
VYLLFHSFRQYNVFLVGILYIQGGAKIDIGKGDETHGLENFVYNA